MSQQLRPQDVVLLLKLLASAKEHRDRMVSLAYELGFSQSEVSNGLNRLRAAGLIDESKQKPLRRNALEFLQYGLKYVFPALPGALCRGIPTAHSALPLSKKIAASKNDAYVWPHSEGKLRGQAVEPLYKSVPEASFRDEKLYQLLALCDAIRVGKVREQNTAREELSKIIALDE